MMMNKLLVTLMNNLIYIYPQKKLNSSWYMFMWNEQIGLCRLCMIMVRSEPLSNADSFIHVKINANKYFSDMENLIIQGLPNMLQ
jgi:hypothetical protein